MGVTHVDACPACVHNVEEPRAVETTTDGVRALYRCSDCGHDWYTSWKEG